MGWLMFPKILVPLDGSEYAESALDTAVKIAHQFNSKLTLIHVSSFSLFLPLHLFGDEGTSLGMDLEESMRVAEVIREAGAEILAKGEQRVAAAGVPVDTVLREGHVVQEIVKAAQEGRYDLIVMGAKGRSKIQEMLLGSVSEKVVRTAPCTVMIVK
jgi:nucleotide-binding universal stress UspA family protein